MTFPFALLVARQRSGTGALGSVLDKHPQLHYLGEIFHPANVGQDKNYFSHLLERVSADARAALPDSNEDNFNAFLNTVSTLGTIPVIDVKYSSLHSLDGGWQAPSGRPWILQYARSLGVPIVHLTRKNLVEVHVSGRLAELNKVWHTDDARRARVRSAKIDPQQLLRFIDSAQHEQEMVDRWLAGHPRLATLDYAEMFEPEGALAASLAERIGAAFGVDALTERTPHFVKQAPASPKDSIENYEEVSVLLAGTHHAWMLGAGAKPNQTSAIGRLSERNRRALDQVPVFRGRQPAEKFGKIDDAFHWHKNHFPYFGPVDVQVGDYSVAMYSGNDDLVAMTYLWYGASSFERHSVALWAEMCRTADIVFDVGAHSALYSLLAAAVNPRAQVAAFEPSRRTHGRILLNSYLNGFERRIKANCLAVSNEKGPMRLLQFRGQNILGVGASILEKDIPVTDDSEIVETIPLDDYCAEHDMWPDLIKIDVEGAEGLALDGAKRLLAEKRPRLLIEITPKTAPDVHRILVGYGYSMSVIDEDAQRLRPFEGVSPHVLNILARPETDE